MSNSLCSQLRYVGVTSLLILQGISIASLARAACYKTPRTAIDAVETDSSFSPALESGGYRVTRIQSDPVLRQRWAMITSCGHPEWPAFALPATGASSLKAPQEVERYLTEGAKAAPVVRAGDIVRLWRQESLLRIEVAGVSEESGGLGKTIRVRLLRRNTDDQSILQQFSGVVRGPSDVEIQP
jgi:flagellar basal body P-ring formation chaperone FlgA